MSAELFWATNCPFFFFFPTDCETAYNSGVVALYVVWSFFHLLFSESIFDFAWTKIAESKCKMQPTIYFILTCPCTRRREQNRQLYGAKAVLVEIGISGHRFSTGTVRGAESQLIGAHISNPSNSTHTHTQQQQQH